MKCVFPSLGRKCLVDLWPRRYPSVIPPNGLYMNVRPRSEFLRNGPAASAVHFSPGNRWRYGWPSTSASSKMLSGYLLREGSAWALKGTHESFHAVGFRQLGWARLGPARTGPGPSGRRCPGGGPRRWSPGPRVSGPRVSGPAGRADRPAFRVFPLGSRPSARRGAGLEPGRPWRFRPLAPVLIASPRFSVFPRGFRSDRGRGAGVWSAA